MYNNQRESWYQDSDHSCRSRILMLQFAAPPNGFPPYMPPGQPGAFRPPLPGMPPPTLNAMPGVMPPFPPGQGGFRPPIPGAMPNFPPTRPPMPGFQGTPGGQPGLGGPSPINMPPFSPGQMPTPGMGLPGRPGFSPHGGPGMGTPGFDPSNGGLPRPPHMVGGPQNPNFVKAVKTTKVFIGSIAPGVTDAILTGLIHVSLPQCGLHPGSRLKPNNIATQLDLRTSLQSQPSDGHHWQATSFRLRGI